MICFSQKGMFCHEAAYLNKFRAAEDEDDLSGYPEWGQEAIQVAGEVLGSDDYISLPSQFDIHEYKIMEEFCLFEIIKKWMVSPSMKFIPCDCLAIQDLLSWFHS
jgi:hypothetical protein